MEKDQFGYVDFLEALIRVTFAYPFTEEEKIDLHNFESRFNHLINKIDNRYSDARTTFERKMTSYEGEN